MFGFSTLQGLGKNAVELSSKDPLYNFYIYTLNQIGLEGEEPDGTFDDQPVQQFADTIVLDLFEVETESAAVPGIEKEAVVIFGLWMRFYHYIYDVVRICRDDGDNGDKTQMINNLDKAAAVWIGRLQVFGDNSRGTMLYNLAERAGFNFAQDHGEAPVNAKIIQSLELFKATIEIGVCSNPDGEGYKILYEEMLKIVTQMNVPLVQNLIHYITTGAALIVIEMYTLAIFPQLISCNVSLFDYFEDELYKLASQPKDEVDLMKLISSVRKMYGCLGLSCSDIGAHTGGSACEDVEVDPIAPIVGYTPTSDVRSVSTNIK